MRKTGDCYRPPVFLFCHRQQRKLTRANYPFLIFAQPFPLHQ
ncbi:Hypothetical protein SU5_0237 [Salmonella enterica subsp. enterica serovar Heidelberg str. B182]|nr:Hypothetical protein SU5_0237 [Salmonella enterica subsp. enterica serovar Heidelberg str. B182]